MGVDVDDAGQHEQPGGVDDLGRARRRARQVGLDRLDAPPRTRDVGPPRAGAVTTVPPRRRGRSRRHGAGSGAPRHRRRRPAPAIATGANRPSSELPPGRHRGRAHGVPGARSETVACRRHGPRRGPPPGSPHERRPRRADRITDHDRDRGGPLHHGSSTSLIDRLGAFPEAAPADLAQAVGPAVVRHDRREVVGRELADLRARRAAAVREEDLALADAARVDRELPGRRVRGVVLVVDARPEVAVRDPRRLAAPAAVDELRVGSAASAGSPRSSAARRAPSGR